MQHILLQFPEIRDRIYSRNTLRKAFWASLGEIGEVFDITRDGKSLLDSQRNICCQSVTQPEVACGMPAVWYQVGAAGSQD